MRTQTWWLQKTWTRYEGTSLIATNANYPRGCTFVPGGHTGQITRIAIVLVGNAHPTKRRGRKPSARDSAIQVAQIRVKRRAAERAHHWIRKRAAQELNSEMGRMGAEDPSGAFRVAPLLNGGCESRCVWRRAGHPSFGRRSQTSGTTSGQSTRAFRKRS